MFDTATNTETGEHCFFCGQARWSDDGPFLVVLHEGTYVSECGCKSYPF